MRAPQNFEHRLRRALPYVVPVAIFAAAAICHLLAIWPIARLQGRGVSQLLVKWDGGWYLRLATEGYPSRVRGASTLGFYPLYPLGIRAVLDATPFPRNVAAVGFASACSSGAMVVFWHLARRLSDAATAYRSVALLAFAPAGFVLSMAYSEGLLILCASAALLMLLDRHWLWAGVFAGLACLARPNGVAAAAACAVAAFLALRENRRDLRPLLAPIIAAIGFVALPIYHQVHAGDAFAYYKTQDRSWDERFDFGVSTMRNLAGFVANPFDEVNEFFAGLAFVMLIGGIVLLIRWRPPAPILTYALVIAVLTFGASAFASTFRLILVGVPFTIAYARVLRGNVFAVAMGISGALFAMLSVAAATVYYTP